MATVQSALQNIVLVLSIVCLTLCQDNFWKSFNREPEFIRYFGSRGFMNRHDARHFCVNNNMTPGISSLMDYETLIKVPYATKNAWIGIFRLKLDRWQFLSGVDFPVEVISKGSQGCGYQQNTDFFSDACYEKKKYVCHGEKGTDRYFTIHHTTLSWYEARNDCLKRGGDLYDANLYGYVAFDTGSHNEHFWVGITKDVWSWTATGKRVNLTYWVPGQPYGNGTCVLFNANGWYLSDCLDDKAQALCFILDIITSTTTQKSTTTTARTTQSSTLPFWTTFAYPRITKITTITRKSTTTTAITTQSSTLPFWTRITTGTTTTPFFFTQSTTTKTSSEPTTTTTKQSSTLSTTTPAMSIIQELDKKIKIIGGVLGGVVALLVIIILAVVIKRNKNTSEPQEPVEEEDPYYSVASLPPIEYEHLRPFNGAHQQIYSIL